MDPFMIYRPFQEGVRARDVPDPEKQSSASRTGCRGDQGGSRRRPRPAGVRRFQHGGSRQRIALDPARQHDAHGRVRGARVDSRDRRHLRRDRVFREQPRAGDCDSHGLGSFRAHRRAHGSGSRHGARRRRNRGGHWGALILTRTLGSLVEGIGTNDAVSFIAAALLFGAGGGDGVFDSRAARVASRPDGRAAPRLIM